MNCFLIGYAIFCMGYPTATEKCLRENMIAEMTANMSHVLEIIDRCDSAKGCCSFHGGLDYCDKKTNRYMCKDGQYSPNCRCNIEDADGRHN
jgi:hypothetical protein